MDAQDPRADGGGRPPTSRSRSATSTSRSMMPIEDVFTITGRGTVVTAASSQGQIKIATRSRSSASTRRPRRRSFTGVEMFNKTLDQAQAGDNAAALLRGTKREEVERGQVLAKPGSITSNTHFKAEVYVLSKDEGGRHTPFFTATGRSSTSARRT